MRDTAPGHDKIMYSQVEKLREESKELLLKLYNNIWERGAILRDMKKIIILPILKPNKKAEEVTSYRPIALISCIGKVLEKMVKNRLQYICEVCEVFPNEQNGFRERRCCSDNLIVFMETVREALNDGQLAIAVLLDLKQAFDSIDHERLLKKLSEMGLKGNVYVYFGDFLKGE